MTTQFDDPRTVLLYPDEKMLVNVVATRMLLRISDLLQLQDRVDIALTGGTDGIAVLEAASHNPLQDAIDFSRVHFWWGDERFVQADDADRNALQARQAWLDTLVKNGKLPESNIHEMPADTRTRDDADNASDATNDDILAEAARSYQSELEYEIGTEGSLDIALFGVGPDGHFASLFPGRDEVLISDDSIKAVGVSHSPKMPPLRVSLTVPFIQQSESVWVFAAGERKADAVSRALGSADNHHVPSSYARGTQESLWMIDEAAASNIDDTEEAA
ncbi:6-phosphogluconolactonase [Alloscardovia theropitheci]|uniref:6-phosphogluconolactonase n=1 Tax=Alloscardovia theropitheci TaxID=2496842 RepID=A0A4R0QSR6_9BIFI|nr:6-phosphogluconolactonase [Alloscardovia theropitheci]TCD54205.1 6-phosphogluconolactonase [Alloscardovia theropitheci]